MRAREAALDALIAVISEGRFLDDALDRHLAALPEARERALARDIAYGVCRNWFRLRAFADTLLDRPLKARDRDLAVVIAIGLYQLEHTRVPPHAAVSETVALCRHLRKAWASALVNAVLRRFQREHDACVARALAHPESLHGHPAWMLDALRAAWPDRWQEMVTANDIQAPMTLRVNARRCSREQALADLAAAGIAARATCHSEQGIMLEQPRDVLALPGFAEGVLSVQDEAAQLAAPLLEVPDGARFLDACAAPGGKLAHVLETRDGVDATALERDPARGARIESTLTRLGLAARTSIVDARDRDAWWDGAPFDRILLDAPCSATGVIRRHPDIKLHRRAGDMSKLVAIQHELLEALWPALARKGRLLYATCSVMPEENGALVAAFASAHDDVELARPQADWGIPAGPGRQILPGEAGMDGFYYALLVKR